MGVRPQCLLVFPRYVRIRSDPNVTPPRRPGMRKPSGPTCIGAFPAASARTSVFAAPPPSPPSPVSKPMFSRLITVTGNAKRRCAAIRVARFTLTDLVVPANLPALLLRPLPLLLLPTGDKYWFTDQVNVD